MYKNCEYNGYGSTTWKNVPLRCEVRVHIFQDAWRRAKSPTPAVLSSKQIERWIRAKPLYRCLPWECKQPKSPSLEVCAPAWRPGLCCCSIHSSRHLQLGMQIRLGQTELRSPFKCEARANKVLLSGTLEWLLLTCMCYALLHEGKGIVNNCGGAMCMGCA